MNHHEAGNMKGIECKWPLIQELRFVDCHREMFCIQCPNYSNTIVSALGKSQTSAVCQKEYFFIIKNNITSLLQHLLRVKSAAWFQSKKLHYSVTSSGSVSKELVGIENISFLRLSALTLGNFTILKAAHDLKAKGKCIKVVWNICRNVGTNKCCPEVLSVSLWVLL